MKKIIFAASVVSVLLGGMACQNRKVQRIDPKEQTDISGRWNDTDSRLVANEMIESSLKGGWRGEFETTFKKKPTVIVGVIKNRTSEQIDPTAFIKNLEAAFINSSAVKVVQSGDERSQVRDERNDQQQFSSEETKKKWGKEKGADFMINGVMTSVVDQYKNQRTVQYQVNLELTDLETNEKVWIGEKQIKKYIKN
ncbi:MAG: penicillin-binding protein activator LpoB [Bacteroidetes bacterium]|jgi:hypothetical protein|nr:penicillin-binding protein activator LpoB [Bacteroidota bacterium]